MAKEKTLFTCNACGGTTPRWLGKCPHCGAWNSLVETVAESASGGKNRLGAPQGYAGLANAQPVTPLSAIEAQDVARTPSGLSELDRVLGGGIVEGSLVLIGGDPGIGKSTLMLHMAFSLAVSGMRILYVSGEESAIQLKLRSDRLGIVSDDILIYPEVVLQEIRQQIAALKPDIVIIDSIQSVFSSQIDAPPGSVSQIREGAGMFMEIAKGMKDRKSVV